MSLRLASAYGRRMLDQKADRYKFVTFTCEACKDTQTHAVPIYRKTVVCVQCKHKQKA